MGSLALSLDDRSGKKDRRELVVAGLLLVLLAGGAFLRFYQLGQGGVGNTYYAATVKSMLLSWKNFFFAAFEPGGSVSVDKPPLGFWIEALSAYFLGVNGFALALPNAIASVFSIFLVYKLVRRPFGPWAGLAAGLVLAFMPVAVATERNNTIDGMLVFVLLLAAWAFLQSVYTGRVRWLFLGAFLVGLGFNIKMLQAFLPLPAFYALYFFGARHGWGRKVLHLAAVTALLLAVSFSWAIAVDLTPAADRPYVDSTKGNSVLELIFGHNGIERLTNTGGGPGGSQPQGGFPGGGPAGMGSPMGQFNPGSRTQMSGGPGGPMGGGGQPGSMDFGSAGTLRLFTDPLAGESSWLLPFVLGGLLIFTFTAWKQAGLDQRSSVILWAGWLLPEALYFTYSQGLMHAYYLIMLGAPLAALSGITLWGLWKLIKQHGLAGWCVAMILAAATLAFEAYTLFGRTSLDVLAIEVAGCLLCAGFILAFVSRMQARLARLALGLLFTALIVAPFTWSALTALNTTSNAALPYAGPARGPGAAGPAMRARTEGAPEGSGAPGNGGEGFPMPGNGIGNVPGGNGDTGLLQYLLANTNPGTYLVATGRANSAAGYILETGRPVLTFGGFLGQYDEVSVAQLSNLVHSGQLRFVLGEDLDRHQVIAAWVRQNCTVVDVSRYSSVSGAGFGNFQGPDSNDSLYDCGG